MPTHAWNFGDGTTATQTHIHFRKEYASAGTYTVTLTSTAANGCSNTASMLVTVSPTPCAGLARNSDPSYYNGNDGLNGMTPAGSTTGINSINLSGEITLYPNPTTGDFRISIGNISGKNAKFIIVDMLGREVHSLTRNIRMNSEIDIQDLNLAGGKYNLIFISDDEQIINKSFVVIK
jgi:PKD repeat protein